MRYVIATVVSAMLIGGVVLYIRQTSRLIEQTMRRALLKQQLAGTLPPELQGVDIQTADLSKLGDFGMTVPAALMRRIRMTMALTDWWYIWGPLVLIVCFGSAALFGRATKCEK
jgi:hypothetical protein